MLKIVLLLLSVASARLSIRYVRPRDPGPTLSCPAQPCRTIDEYATSKGLTHGSTFIFLAGDHSLQTLLNLSNTLNVTLRGETVNSALIFCRFNAAILCENASGLQIEQLTFELNSSNIQEVASNLPGLLNINYSKSVGISGVTFHGNVSLLLRGAVSVFSSTVTVNNSNFKENSREKGGAISLINCKAVIENSVFYRNLAKKGGAISASNSSVIIEKNVFKDNLADYKGGALYASHQSTVILNRNSFLSNQASFEGGAVYTSKSYLHVTGRTSNCSGSSLPTKRCTLSPGMTLFSQNQASYGGALYVDRAPTRLNGETMFEGNSALGDGAGMYIDNANVTTKALPTFYNNTAQNKGGGIYVESYMQGTRQEISANFTSNRAHECGGAIYIDGQRVVLNGISAAANSISAICVFNGNVSFIGNTTISENTGKLGGGIQISAQNSRLAFSSNCITFEGNTADAGGAIYLQRNEFHFRGFATFINNSANSKGGAIYSHSGKIIFSNLSHIRFLHNSAELGGAMCLNESSLIEFHRGTKVSTSRNSASIYGGGIYHVDSTTPAQCNFTGKEAKSSLPLCFMQIYYPVVNVMVSSVNDTAGRGGGFMFGGLLDRCRINLEFLLTNLWFPFDFLHSNFLNVVGDSTRAISSKPYQLCYCVSKEAYNCSNAVIAIKVVSGQQFNLSLVAIDQMETPISATITSELTQTARLNSKQAYQTLSPRCTDVSYNLYSTVNEEELILHPDGPCSDIGLAKVFVKVTILPCPHGFRRSNDNCVCDERLTIFNVSCKVEEEAIIRKEAKEELWIGSFHDRSTYQGLVLSKACPIEYCKTSAVNIISLDDPNIQCIDNRGGLLCGACRTNYSLMLGSSQCGECSNVYLALLLPFAAAGIALVVFISTLQLTVTIGIINSILFYADIIQVNKGIYFHNNGQKVLTVFIAWMNLDLGFETCFYHGMTAYFQTWLQYAFPVYVWILITAIILISRHSITVSKLIGHNPIAVLATLLLMSYTKILKIVIDVYSSVKLYYPDNRVATMWFKDANVPYLQSWHLLLTIVTSLILVIFFLPYTFLLLFGFKLYRFSDRRYFHWLNRLKPFLDSYYAPYKPHTCFWTGFLLLVRCALYITFSAIDALSPANKMIAIICIFTLILTSGWHFKVYKRKSDNIVESSIYFNLVVLSSIKLSGSTSKILVSLLIGIVFGTMLGTIVYQFFALYISNTKFWRILKDTLTWRKSRDSLARVQESPTPQGQHSTVTETYIELREPLIDNVI